MAAECKLYRKLANIAHSGKRVWVRIKIKGGQPFGKKSKDVASSEDRFQQAASSEIGAMRAVGAGPS